jgi:Holliday junction DNA helicase RuvB P-loop domain
MRGDEVSTNSESDLNTLHPPTLQHSRQHDHRSLILSVLRWCAVLPASACGWFLASFPVHWTVMIVRLRTPYDDSMVNPARLISAERLEALGVALFCSLAFVWCGTTTAPRFRLATAGALAALWLVATGLMVGGLAVYANDAEAPFLTGPSDWVQLTAVAALNIAGAVVAFVLVFRDEAKLPTEPGESRRAASPPTPVTVTYGQAQRDATPSPQPSASGSMTRGNFLFVGSLDGASSFAQAVAAQSGGKLRATDATVLGPGDMAAILVNLNDEDVLLVDNAEMLPDDSRQWLEEAMANGVLNFTVKSQVVKLSLHNFQVIARVSNENALSRDFITHFHTIRRETPFIDSGREQREAIAMKAQRVTNLLLQTGLLALFGSISYGLHFLAGWADSLPMDAIFAWSLALPSAVVWVLVWSFVLGERGPTSSIRIWGMAFGCVVSMTVLARYAQQDFRLWYLVAMLPMVYGLLRNMSSGMELDLINTRLRKSRLAPAREPPLSSTSHAKDEPPGADVELSIEPAGSEFTLPTPSSGVPLPEARRQMGLLLRPRSIAIWVIAVIVIIAGTTVTTYIVARRSADRVRDSGAVFAQPSVAGTMAAVAPTDPVTASFTPMVPSIQFQWLETDGGCNVRSTLPSATSKVEFLAISYRGSGFAATDTVVVVIFRDNIVVRTTAPLRAAGATLCLYGPVAGQSPGGWPPGLNEAQFQSGGQLVSSGQMRFN